MTDDEIYELELKGCASTPLMHYLKALGVFRIVAEQRDENARCFWSNGKFVLVSKLDKTELRKFFLEQYAPTPIITPWLGRGGFLEGEEESSRTGSKMIGTFSTTTSSRFSEYAGVIKAAKKNTIVTELNKLRGELRKIEHEMKKIEKANGKKSKEYTEKKEELSQVKTRYKTQKNRVLCSLRSDLPESILSWMDACFVLSTSLGSRTVALWPPLLGSGGNDGSQDFAVNFMEAISKVISVETGQQMEQSERLLNNSLFLEPTDGLVKELSSGQFNPFAVGGLNSTTGFQTKGMTNPWDFVLMLEGTILFASAATRHCSATEIRGSYPFMVEIISAGYSSAAYADRNSKRQYELWAPLWGRRSGLKELKTIMSEGRARIGSRTAQNGLDFSRAIAGLGIDRGITAFQRYGFLGRNGDNSFAVPLDYVPVQRQPQADILFDIESWLGRFSLYCSEKNAPASAQRVLSNIESAMFQVCKQKDPVCVQALLTALGEGEKFIAKQTLLAKPKSYQKQRVLKLSPRWLKEANDDSPEFRLAASLASVYGYYKTKKGVPFIMPLRAQLEPLPQPGIEKIKETGYEVVWREGSLVKALNSIVSHRLTRMKQSDHDTFTDMGHINANFADITEFIEGRLNDQRIADLLWGLILIDWSKYDSAEYVVQVRTEENDVIPCAGYAILKLCFLGGKINGANVPIITEIHGKMRANDDITAIRLAVRRLRASGIEISQKMQSIRAPHGQAERIAASLMFPLNNSAKWQLMDRFKRPIKA